MWILFLGASLSSCSVEFICASPGMSSGSPHAPDIPKFSHFPNSTLGLKVKKQRFGKNGGFSQPRSPESLSWCKLQTPPASLHSFWEFICHFRKKKKPNKSSIIKRGNKMKAKSEQYFCPALKVILVRKRAKEIKS